MFDYVYWIVFIRKKYSVNKCCKEQNYFLAKFWVGREVWTFSLFICGNSLFLIIVLLRKSAYLKSSIFHSTYYYYYCYVKKEKEVNNFADKWYFIQRKIIFQHNLFLGTAHNRRPYSSNSGYHDGILYKQMHENTHLL